MKNPLFCLLALGIGLVSAPVSVAKADDTTNLAAGPTNGAAATSPQGERGEKLKEAIDQLDLTDAQKQQIKTIRANTSPGKERRQQIMAVLTPEQKEKLKAMIQQHMSERQAGAGAVAN